MLAKMGHLRPTLANMGYHGPMFVIMDQIKPILPIWVIMAQYDNPGQISANRNFQYVWFTLIYIGQYGLPLTNTNQCHFHWSNTGQYGGIQNRS